MAQGFNLTAQLNLVGPSNIRQIAAQIRRDLGTVNANVNFKLDPAATKNVTALNSALKQLNSTLGNTNTTATSASNAIKNLGKSINSVKASNLSQQLNNAAKATSNLSKSNSTVKTSIASVNNEMQEFGKQAGLAVRRFSAFATVTSVIYGVTNSISRGVQAFIEYDKELVRLQQVTGQSLKGLSSLQSTITSLSTTLGVGSKELTTVAVTLAQAGLSAKDTEKSLRALALSALTPSFDNMNETVEGSIALMRQFGIGAGDLEKALGSVNAVAAKFAVEASDIISAIQRTGGVFATASRGVSEGTDALNEFIAVFTSVRATTRESAETIATGLRTIFTRIQRGDTIDALKEFGVNLQDAEGRFVGAYKAVELLSKGLNSIDPRELKFSRIVEELGGFRQIGKVIPLIQQFATAQQALSVAQQGQGSLAADAAVGQKSLGNQITKVREQFFALFRELGQSQGFQTLAKGALGLASALIKILDATKSLLPALSVVLAFKGSKALTEFVGGLGRGFRRGPDNKVGAGQNTPFASGGKVRKFARGGVVPGSGDRDTVPAMLTPGEFVIRKKAVETIGADNLHSMNKYGAGKGMRSGKSSRRKKFAKGGGVSEIRNYGARDGDSWSVDYTPSSDPISTTTRGTGYDAYEINKGKKWEKALGDIATGIADDAFTKNKKLSNTNDLYKSLSGGFSSGRPLHSVPKKISKKMIDMGVAKAAQKDNTATGFGPPNETQIDTLTNYDYFSEANQATKEFEKSQKLAQGGVVQKFMAGGKAESTPFGTGETKFPKRITNAYAKELQKKLDKERVDNTFNPYPSNERITIDPEEVSQKFQSEPFDRKRFLSLFNTKISRNELVGNLSDFAKFIGLPGEDLAKVLPQTIDFGGELQRSGNRGTFSRDPFGTQGYDNKGLEAFGFTKADEEDLFGYQKLMDEKTKEIQKIMKTPTRTFDDGSFSYDSDAFTKAMDEKSSLGKKISDVMGKRAVARKGLMEQKKGILDSTGRGFVSMASNAFEKNQPKNVLYHELTHQLLNSLRTQSEDSFTKYKERVSQLFNGDNDDLADAFDALGGSYNSADVIYGRSYKNGLLNNVLQDLRRKTMDAGGRSADPDLSKEAYSMWVESGQQKNAREYRPINPKINDILLKGGQKQETLDKVEDYGKEEFLTTLIQHAPKLDSNMQGILDSTLNELLGNAGIQRQQYAEGGKVTRNLGYIDFDVINDPANAEVIEQAMKKAGVDGPRNYTEYLTNLAIKARKEKSLKSLKALYGVAGAGKSSIATGRGSNDTGTLRQTNRFPILKPDDITKASEVMLLTSTVSQDKLEGMLQEVDRAYTLSSTTKEEKDRILKQRTMRDVSGVGLFGRAAGSTTGAALDTAKEEALLEDRLGSKSVVLGRKEDGGLRRKTGNELVQATKKKLAFTWGGFAPTTAGHESIMEAAKAAGIPYEDFIALVGSDEAVDAENYRTAVFDKDFRLALAKAGFGSKGASVLPKAFGDMSVPLAFDMGEKDGRRQVTLAGEGSMAFVADKTEKEMEKYKKAGYGVSNLKRTGGISGTQVRDLLLNGNLDGLQQVVSPSVFSLLKDNMVQLQNRSNVLPTLIEQAEAAYKEEVSAIDQQLLATGITRANNKKAETDPEYAAQLELYQSLKDKKKKLQTKKSFEPYRLLRQLAASDPAKYGLRFDTDPSASGSPSVPSSAIQQAILAKVAKETSVKKSSGILPAQGTEILKRFGTERLPNDSSFGPFAGKTVRDTADGGKLKYWNSAFRPETKADKLAYYTATRDYLIDRFNQSQGSQRVTALKDTTNAVLSSAQLGLVGLNPLGYTGLLGPETWNLGTDPSGQERSIDASIVQRGLPNQYQNVIDYLSGQTEEIVGGASKLLGIEPKKLNKKQRETLGQGNIEGALLEQIFGSADATILDDALRTRPIDFPMGIGPKAASIFGIDPDIPTEVKRTIDSGSRGKAVKEFQRYFREKYGIPDPEKEAVKLASGGSVQDTVPALLTPGEFVVNKQAAQKIGYSKLNQLNKADKIKGYNKGGTVGGIQKLASGGLVDPVAILKQIGDWASATSREKEIKRFDTRPSNIDRDTVAIPKEVVTSLEGIVKNVNDLGFSAAESAALIKRLRNTSEISYQELESSLSKDIANLKLLGAGFDTIIQAETALAKIRAKGQEQIELKQNLEGAFSQRGTSSKSLMGGALKVTDIGAGSAASQNAIEKQAEYLIKKQVSKLTASGKEVDLEKITEQAYKKSASQVSGIKTSDFTSYGISGKDIKNYIDESKKNAKTLRDLDQALLDQKLAELKNDATYAAASKSEKARREKDLRTETRREISVRRSLINDLAKRTGSKGVGAIDMMDFNNSPILKALKSITLPGALMGIAGGAGVVAGQGNLIGKIAYGGRDDASQINAAKTAAAIESSGTIMSTGMSAAAAALEMIPGKAGMIAAAVIAAGTLLYSAVEWFTDYSGSQQEAAMQKQKELIDIRGEEAQRRLDMSSSNLDRAPNNIEFINAFTDALAGINAITAESAVIDVTNAKIDFNKNSSVNQDILDAGQEDVPLGFMGFNKIGDWIGRRAAGILPEFMGGAQAEVFGAPEKAKVDAQIASSPVNQGASTRALQTVTQAMMTQNASRENILTGDQFKAQRTSVMMADVKGVAQFNTMMQQAVTAAGRELTPAEIIEVQNQATEAYIANGSAVLEATMRSAEVAKALEAADMAGRKLAMSLSKMIDAIDQSISRIQSESQERAKATKQMIKSVLGEGGPASYTSNARNIIDNPLAYSDAEYRGAMGQAGNIVGGEEGKNLTGLIGVGANLSDTMFAGINNRLKGRASLTKEEAAKEAIDTGKNYINNLDVSDEVKKILIDKLTANVNQITENMGDAAFANNPSQAVDQFADAVRNSSSALGDNLEGRARETAKALLALKDNALNDFAQSLQESSEYLRQATRLRMKADKIAYDANNDIREIFTGVGESYTESRDSMMREVGSLTGGITDPAQIGAMIEKEAENNRTLNKGLQGARNAGDDAASKDFIKNIQDSNDRLKNYNDALEQLADSTEVYQKALDEARNITSLQANRKGFIEKLLTNTPEEADKLNQSLIRLQRNLSGGLNNATNQRDARKAFNETYFKTGNLREAARAGNTVLANQRKETLGLQQDEGFRAMRTANIQNQSVMAGRGLIPQEQIDAMFRQEETQLMRQMAVESGFANNPAVMQAINAVENPNAEPMAQAAAQQILEAAGLRKAATEEQARVRETAALIANTMATNDLTAAINGLAVVMQQAFAQNAAVEAGNIPGVLGNRVPINVPVQQPIQPQAKAKGGMIFASAGQYIDFKPKGTDRIPAMLTDGEFVINARSTSKHLPLIEAINNDKLTSNNAMYASRGGVAYLAQGGLVNLEAQKRKEERIDAQKESWMMSEAAGRRPDEVVSRTASSWAESQTGYGKWQTMTEEQRQSEAKKYEPEFQNRWDNYNNRQADAQLRSANNSGYDSIKEDPNSGIVGVNFYNEEKKRSKERFEKASAAETEASNNQSLSATTMEYRPSANERLPSPTTMEYRPSANQRLPVADKYIEATGSMATRGDTKLDMSYTTSIVQPSAPVPLVKMDTVPSGRGVALKVRPDEPMVEERRNKIGDKNKILALIAIPPRDRTPDQQSRLDALRQKNPNPNMDEGRLRSIGRDKRTKEENETYETLREDRLARTSTVSPAARAAYAKVDERSMARARSEAGLPQPGQYLKPSRVPRRKEDIDPSNRLHVLWAKGKANRSTSEQNEYNGLLKGDTSSSIASNPATEQRKVAETAATERKMAEDQTTATNQPVSPTTNNPTPTERIRAGLSPITSNGGKPFTIDPTTVAGINASYTSNQPLQKPNPNDPIYQTRDPLEGLSRRIADTRAYEIQQAQQREEALVNAEEKRTTETDKKATNVLYKKPNELTDEDLRILDKRFADPTDRGRLKAGMLAGAGRNFRAAQTQTSAEAAPGTGIQNPATEQRLRAETAAEERKVTATPGLSSSIQTAETSSDNKKKTEAESAIDRYKTGIVDRAKIAAQEQEFDNEFNQLLKSGTWRDDEGNREAYKKQRRQQVINERNQAKLDEQTAKIDNRFNEWLSEGKVTEDEREQYRTEQRKYMPKPYMEKLENYRVPTSEQLLQDQANSDAIAQFEGVQQVTAAERARAQQQKAEEDRQASLWINSSNPATAVAGYVGGVTQGIGDALYGAANITAGAVATVASPLVGAAGYALSGDNTTFKVGDENNLRNRTAENLYDERRAAGQPMPSQSEVRAAQDAAVIRARAFTANSDRLNNQLGSYSAATSAAADVGLRAMGAGATSFGEAGLAIAGMGPIQTGDQTALQRNDARNVELAGGMDSYLGFGTAFAQTTGYAASQGVGALINAEGAVTNIAGRAISSGARMAGRAVPGAAGAGRVAGRVAGTVDRAITGVATGAGRLGGGIPGVRGVGGAANNFVEGVKDVATQMGDVIGVRGIVPARPQPRFKPTRTTKYDKIKPWEVGPRGLDDISDSNRVQNATKVTAAAEEVVDPMAMSRTGSSFDETGMGPMRPFNNSRDLDNPFASIEREKRRIAAIQKKPKSKRNTNLSRRKNKIITEAETRAPAIENYGRRVFGQKPGEEFIYRGSYGSSIEEGFDLTKMGSTGSVYGAGVYGGFDLRAAGQGRKLAQQYKEQYLLKFIRENPGVSVDEIAKNFRGGMYQLRLKNPELFVDAGAAFKGTREENIINKLLQKSGIDPSTVPDSTTPIQAYNAISKRYRKQLAGLSENQGLSASELDALAKAKTSEQFAREGIPGMAAYRNPTRFKDGDGSGVVSIFDQNAFEIISKTGVDAKEVKRVATESKTAPGFTGTTATPIATKTKSTASAATATKPQTSAAPKPAPSAATKILTPNEQLAQLDAQIASLKSQEKPDSWFGLKKGVSKKEEIDKLQKEANNIKKTMVQKIVREKIVSTPALEKARKEAEGLRFDTGHIQDAKSQEYLDEWNKSMDMGIPNEYRHYGASYIGGADPVTRQVSRKLEAVGIESDIALGLDRKRSDPNLGKNQYYGKYTQTNSSESYTKRLDDLKERQPDKIKPKNYFGIVDLPTKDGTVKRMQIHGPDDSGRQGAILYSIPIEEAEKLGLAEKLTKQGYQSFNRGGMVYANNGAFIDAKPKGKDTNIAMLADGEFVVNDEATKKNLPVLQAINDGYFNRDGIVNYMANGGVVGPKYYANGGLGEDDRYRQMAETYNSMVPTYDESMSRQSRNPLKRLSQARAQKTAADDWLRQQMSNGPNPAQAVGATSAPIDPIIQASHSIKQSQSQQTGSGSGGVSNNGIDQVQSIINEFTSSFGGQLQEQLGQMQSMYENAGTFMENMNTTTSTLVQGLNSSSNSLQRYSESISSVSIPETVTFQGNVTSSHVFNGAEAANNVLNTLGPTMASNTEAQMGKAFSNINRGIGNLDTGAFGPVGPKSIMGKSNDIKKLGSGF